MGQERKNKRKSGCENGGGEKFSQEVRDRVFERQDGKSVITERPIAQYHHISGRMGRRTDTSAENCLGVDFVAHALIHLWQWSVYGDDGEWDACQGLLCIMTAEEKVMFYELKDRTDLSGPYIERYEEMLNQEEKLGSMRTRDLHYV